jgi:cytochrome c
MEGFLMRRIITTLILLVLAIALVGCECADREERIAEAKTRQGLDNSGAEAPPLSVGAQLYRDKTCNTCHGDDGVKPLLPNYPVLAHQGEEYVLKQLREIKSGERHNGQTAAMKPIMEAVTEEDIIILAKFIATELGADKQVGTGIVDPESPGAILFKKRTCWSCHGKDGATPILKKYPRIAGNTKEYALQQMTDIKNGDRANGMDVLGMKGIMHLVNEEEIAHLAEYISTLTRPFIEPSVEETTK